MVPDSQQPKRNSSDPQTTFQRKNDSFLVEGLARERLAVRYQIENVRADSQCHASDLQNLVRIVTVILQLEWPAGSPQNCVYRILKWIANWLGFWNNWHLKSPRMAERSPWYNADRRHPNLCKITWLIVCSRFSMGLWDYLFQKRLALRFFIDSFRFDFRGCHESGGQRTQGGPMKDVRDLVTVVSYLRNTYGYEIDVVVGHSRGSVVGMYWLCTSEEGQRVRAMVNVSGRYRMHRVYDVAETYKEQWDAKGYYERTVTVARQAIVERIYPHDLEEISQWNTAIVWDKFPNQIHVLTLHGLVDKAIPAYDAVIYSRALGARTPGTHNLHLIEKADHNFTNCQDEVVDCILEWWHALNQGHLKTGILRTGVRGKL